MVHRFEYLNHALAAVLVFIRAKFLRKLLPRQAGPAFSLAVAITLAYVAGGITVSRLGTQRGRHDPSHDRVGLAP